MADQSLTTQAPGDPATTAEVLVRARDLERWFGSLRAVHGVGFEVRRGELVGFLGPNGAGKSTTMRMLTGSLEPDAGSVRIAGHELHGAGTRASLAARRRIGFLPEHTPLHGDMRVDRYLEFVAALHGLDRSARRAAVARVVDDCDLGGHADRKVATLSKGYRQRVGLAQALVASPDVLVLDEPTSGLDPAEVLRIRELVRALARTRTVLLSTHVLPEVEALCQRVLILAAGRLVADGDLAELLRQEGPGLVLEVSGPVAADELRGALADLAGGARAMGEARALAAPARWRLELEVSDRLAAAADVSARVARRGWTLLELSPRVATLEAVFLRRTAGLERARPEAER